jgi:hypothetical protein
MTDNSGSAHLSKGFQGASHKCVCCNKDEASGRDTVAVTAAIVAYGIIEHFSTAPDPCQSTLSSLSPLSVLLSRSGYDTYPDALVRGLATLSKLHRQHSFLQQIIDCIKTSAAECTLDDDNVYYTDILAISTTKIKAAANEYEEAKLMFENAKSDFVTAFRNHHQDTSFRRCKIVT